MMSSIFVYAVESSICLALLWLFYQLLLGRDTLHGRNRWFLIASMIFSAVAPLLEINIAPGIPAALQGGVDSLLLPETLVTPASTAGNGLSRPGLLPGIYLAGLVLSVAMMIAFSARLVQLLFSGKQEGRVVRVPSCDLLCFSAFGHIFISSSVPADRAQRMISHEMKHIALGHHRDLLLAGLITALQWFNPAVWLVSRSLKALHEYEADSRCITDGEDIHSYQELLLASVFRTPVALFSNSFSKYSLLKTRFNMMTKKRTGGLSSLKLAVALPLALMLLFVFSCKDRSGSQTANPVVPAAAAVEAEAETQVVYDTVSAGADAGDVLKVAEVMPAFQDDLTGAALMNWISANITYPDEAKQKGIQGRVFIQFVIDEEGNVTNPVIIKSADPLLDRAAFEVMSRCPAWSPGLQGGKPVKVSFAVPINFALN
jgi:TonB family protein